MSVIILQPKEYYQLAETVIASKDLRDSFWSTNEQLENEFVFASVIKSERSHTDNAIMCFFDRLYLANQLAFFYQYSEKEMVFLRLDANTTELPYGLKEFYEQLRHLRYNLYTNSGRIFIGGEDEKRLDRLINEAAYSLIK